MFKRVFTVLPAVCLATAFLAAGAAWAAESPFIGAWKLDPAKTRMPDQMKVESKGGDKYAFDFGGGVETIAVDGTDQPGGYGGTLLSVKPEAPDTWIVQRKQGDRLLLKATWTLSKDGRTLRDDFRQWGSSGRMVSMDYVYRRTGRGSGFAGDWQSIKETMTTPFPMQVKAFQGDGLSFTTAVDSKTLSVKFDGKDYPQEGPFVRKGASSSVKRVDARTLVITDKADGKVTDTETVGLSPDLKTLTVTTRYVGSDRPTVQVFERA